MTLKLASNRIYVEDATNGVVFDTGAGMFRALNYADGYQDVIARTATSTSTVCTVVNVDTNYTLASVDSSCTDVLGMVQISRTPAGGMPATNADPSGHWQAVNGSKLDFQWWCGPQSSYQSETALVYCCAIGWYTFKVVSGSLILREQLALRAPQAVSSSVTWTSTRAATRLYYKLYIGSFIT